MGAIHFDYIEVNCMYTYSIYLINWTEPTNSNNNKHKMRAVVYCIRINMFFFSCFRFDHVSKRMTQGGPSFFFVLCTIITVFAEQTPAFVWVMSHGPCWLKLGWFFFLKGTSFNLVWVNRLGVAGALWAPEKLANEMLLLKGKIARNQIICRTTTSFLEKGCYVFCPHKKRSTTALSLNCCERQS